MTIRFTVATLLFTALMSCTSTRRSENFISSLRCGMTMAEVRDRAGRELNQVTSVAFRGVHGTHTVENQDETVWLEFHEDHLKAFSLWKPKPWALKAVEISPKTNLCNGDQTYFVRLSLQTNLSDPVVFLNGEIIEDPWNRPMEIPAGVHDIRVESSDSEPILKQVTFPDGESGLQWLKIDHTDRRPRPDQD